MVAGAGGGWPARVTMIDIIAALERVGSVAEYNRIKRRVSRLDVVHQLALVDGLIAARVRLRKAGLC